MNQWKLTNYEKLSLFHYSSVYEYSIFATSRKVLKEIKINNVQGLLWINQKFSEHSSEPSISRHFFWKRNHIDLKLFHKIPFKLGYIIIFKVKWFTKIFLNFTKILKTCEKIPVFNEDTFWKCQFFGSLNEFHWTVSKLPYFKKCRG